MPESKTQNQAQVTAESTVQTQRIDSISEVHDPLAGEEIGDAMSLEWSRQQHALPDGAEPAGADGQSLDLMQSMRRRLASAFQDTAPVEDGLGDTVEKTGYTRPALLDTIDAAILELTEMAPEARARRIRDLMGQIQSCLKQLISQRDHLTEDGGIGPTGTLDSDVERLRRSRAKLESLVHDESFPSTL